MAGVALEVLATGGCADQVGAEPTERLDEERRAAAEGNVELTPQLRNVTLNGLQFRQWRVCTRKKPMQPEKAQKKQVKGVCAVDLRYRHIDADVGGGGRLADYVVVHIEGRAQGRRERCRRK